MNRITANILGLLTAGWLVAIAVMVSAHEEQGDWRTASQRKADAAYLASVLERYKHPRTKQETALMEVWNLTEADVAKPVELFERN